MFDYLNLYPRPSKPREKGITHVIDRGAGLSAVEDLLASCADLIDIIKLGWGTGYITSNLRDKVALYQAANIPVCFGGTLLEVFIAQNKLTEYSRMVADLKINHVEVSTGVLQLTLDEKLDIIKKLSQDFVVLSEVGSKDVNAVVAPYRWLEEIEAELAGGAWKVIAEARESGTVGLYRKTGEVRSGLVEEIVTRVDPGQLIFEAPLKPQQVWFIKQFGPNVNLGNIATDDVIPLETLRLGLRGDTLREFQLGEWTEEQDWSPETMPPTNHQTHS